VGFAVQMVDHPNDACPICKSKARPLDKVGDWLGFDCERQSRSPLEMPGFMYAGIDQWEAALNKAKAREPDAWAPLIQIL